jgi:hypothetical protein
LDDEEAENTGKKKSKMQDRISASNSIPPSFLPGRTPFFSCCPLLPVIAPFIAIIDGYGSKSTNSEVAGFYLLLYIRQHAGLFRRRTNVNSLQSRKDFCHFALTGTGAAAVAEHVDGRTLVLSCGVHLRRQFSPFASLFPSLSLSMCVLLRFSLL